MRNMLLAILVLVAFSAMACHLSAQPPVQQPTKEQLEKWLKQYPRADADGDGVLSPAEADEYRRKVLDRRRQKGEEPPYAFRTEFAFATMSDGVPIALAVGYPDSCDPGEATRGWPAIFEMMGYPDSAVPRAPSDFGNRYVTVRASLRGAGASGGTIDAISPRNGLDGHEVIEEWIVKQPWSNGRVALHGHSWGGLTGFMIAATNPPHLEAVAVSGLFDDVYRDIGCIGGVHNSGFPVSWMVNLYKPTGPFDSGEAAIRARGMSSGDYEEIAGSRPPWELERSILWKSLTSFEYQQEFAQASPGAFASQVRAPIHIMHAYQDEQTGPGGPWLWNYIPDEVPKHLVLSNGDHGDVAYFHRQRMEWLDFWTLRDGQGDRPEFTQRGRRVQVYFETPTEPGELNQPLEAADFPLPDTHWTRFYLSGNGRLAADGPADGQPQEDSYRVVVGGSGDDVDGVRYLLEFDQPTAICGPLAVQLWLTCTAIDTDLFVVVADVDSQGTTQLLQRGLLRASHRRLDQQKSVWVNVDGQQVLVRPRHTHQDAQPLVPGQPYALDVEVFPVGHVFRQGHQLALWISQPPQGDPVTRRRDGQPSYNYASAMPPATVRILRSADHPSSILLPVLPRLPPIGVIPPTPGKQAGVFVH